jgi:hypothetical protein
MTRVDIIELAVMLGWLDSDILRDRCISKFEVHCEWQGQDTEESKFLFYDTEPLQREIRYTLMKPREKTPL